MEIDSFISTAREVMRGVVQIHVQGLLENDVLTTLNPEFVVPSNWSGSGFFIEAAVGEGYILTNAHVVRNACKIEITSMLTSEEPFAAEVVGLVKHLEPDVALIRLKDGELKRYQEIAGVAPKTLSLAKKSLIHRGHGIKAVGYPLGMVEPNITAGEITNFISGSGDTSEKYVTDAAINPGNSGGPSIDREGNVIGINTSIFSNAENVGFITPISFANIILENLVSQNEPVLSDLGGEIQKNSLALSEFFKQERPEGVVVTKIEKRGTLDKAGVKLHDVILSIDHFHFDRHGIVLEKEGLHHRNIYDIVKLIPIGETFNLKVWRNKKRVELAGTAQKSPTYGIQSEPIIANRKYMKCFGMSLQELNFEIINALESSDQNLQVDFVKRLDSERPWVVVTSFEQDDQAYKMGWLIGELITEVEGQKIHSLEDLSSALTKFSNNGKKKVLICCASGRLGHFSLGQENFSVSYHKKI